jgi:recombination protein RecR
VYPTILQDLIDQLRKLPGVGAKTAERYAFALMQLSKEEIQQFSQTLLHAKIDLKSCQTCGHLSVKEQCDICLDAKRDHQTICVVQDVKDLIAIEKTQQFKGVYHVLHGAISTSKGILPEDLNLESLIQRTQTGIKEIILATNPTVEGEMTALYLVKRLEHSVSNITRLAHGLPMGANMDYADELTLIKALEGRHKL